jgi:hypothetical protein
MRIYEKSVNFVSPNPKVGAKLAIFWRNEDLFDEDFRSSIPSLSSTLNHEPFNHELE